MKDERLCGATLAVPYQDDWTDEADAWHEEGEIRLLFGELRFSCGLASGHVGPHDWPEPKDMVAPQPKRPMSALGVMLRNAERHLPA